MNEAPLLLFPLSQLHFRHFCPRFASLADVRVLSPNRPSDWLATRREGLRVRVFCGEFASACPTEDVEGLTVVPGAADYLPGWPQLAFGRQEVR